MANQTVKVVFDGKDNTGKAITSLRGNLNNANKAIGQIKSSLGGMTSAIGLAAGAAGFGLMAKKALETADNLAKTSTRLGVAAKDLGALQLAANYAGVETGTFNKLMEIFQKRVGEAADGTGQAREVLQKFGISAEKLATLPLDKQLKIIADEFKNLKNPAERAAAASDLFSNRGIKLLNFLDHGSEGLDELRAEFKALGLEIDDNALGQIESFNDSVTKFQGIVQAALVKGLSEAAPQMEKVSEKLAEMAVPLTGKLLDGFEFLLDNLGLITKLFAGFIAVMAVTRVIQFATALIALGKALATIRVAAIATQAALGPVGLVMAAISTAAVVFSDDVVAATDSLDDMVGGSDDATDSTDDLEKALSDLEKTTKNIERPLNDHADAVDEIAEESKVAATETDEFRKALEKLRDKVKAPTKSIDDFQKKVAILTEQFNKGEIGGDDFNRMLAEMTKELTGVEDELQDNIDKQKALEAAIDAAIKTGGENESQLAAMRRELEKLKGEQADLILETEGLTKAQIDLLDEIKGTTDAVSDYQNAVKNLDQLLANGKITQDEYNDSLADFNEEMTGIVDPIRQADREIEALEAQIEALGENTDGTSATLQTLKARLEAAKQAASDLAGPQGQAMIKDYYDEIAKGTDPGEALDKLEAKLKEAETAAGQLFGVPMLTKIRGFFDAIGAGAAGEGAIGLLNGALTDLEGAFADFFTSGKLEFDDFVGSIIDGLKRIAAEAIVSVGLNFVKNLVPGLATGGQVEGFAVGGRVTGPGGPREDRVPAMLSPGEYVIQASSVSKFGAGFFEALNAGRLPGFASGGALADVANFGPLPPFGETLGFIPGLQYVAAILQAIKLFTSFLSDGGTEQFRAANAQMMIAKDNWIGDNVMGAMTGLSNVFGKSMQDFLIPEYGLDENGIPIVTKAAKAVEIIGKINQRTPLPGSDTKAGVKQNIEVMKGFEGLSSELAEFLYDYMGQEILKMVVPSFNLDDEFGTMYNAAAGIVARQYGGPLERGQASVVGEAGPELFVPGQGGTVSPISKDGGRQLIKAVQEVREEVAALRRQVGRSSGAQLAGSRK